MSVRRGRKRLPPAEQLMRRKEGLFHAHTLDLDAAESLGWVNPLMGQHEEKIVLKPKIARPGNPSKIRQVKINPENTRILDCRVKPRVLSQKAPEPIIINSEDSVICLNDFLSDVLDSQIYESTRPQPPIEIVVENEAQESSLSLSMIPASQVREFMSDSINMIMRDVESLSSSTSRIPKYADPKEVLWEELKQKINGVDKGVYQQLLERYQGPDHLRWAMQHEIKKLTNMVRSIRFKRS